VKDALDAGLVYNFHMDTPVVKPDMMHTVWTAVNRVSRSGAVIGEDQKIGVYDALKGITINAAYAYFEENEKGSIKEGKRADLVVLSGNPLKVDPMTIREIKVVETIKDGVTVYTA
ncbi:MAG: amidohydrolase family protein, partial [Peptococcaceae bacterium]|nr:amidohydrolase family protein [Peptococcaceae bacterium]